MGELNENEFTEIVIDLIEGKGDARGLVKLGWVMASNLPPQENVWGNRTACECQGQPKPDKKFCWYSGKRKKVYGTSYEIWFGQSPHLQKQVRIRSCCEKI